MTYLDNNLMTLNTNLLRANFDRILASIWVEVLEEFDDVLARPDEVSTIDINIYIYINVYGEYLYSVFVSVRRACKFSC